MQWWCKPNAENLFFAEVQPTIALFTGQSYKIFQTSQNTAVYILLFPH
jgi:hypothetical protein